jgi:predicted protein tyrosine phosphatase
MELPFRITVCGLQELSGHAGAGVTHVLSILDPDHPAPTEFGAYGEHAKLELRFDDIIEDERGRVAPTEADVRALLKFGRDLDAEIARGAHLLVHCHAGVSRSSASMALLIAQAAPDRSGEEVFNEVLAIRPQIWPNLRIVEIGDRLLGRGGELVRAVQTIYRRQAKVRPDFLIEMRAYGRGREAALAES